MDNPLYSIDNSVCFQIRNIDPKNEEHIEEISLLHLKLLDWGPMARLGELFLKKFCYTVLIEDGLMQAAVAEINGKPAGFIAYTDKSINFHRFAIRNHFWYVVYLIIISIFIYPWTVLRLPKALWLMISRRKEKLEGEDPSAEILAIGVLPEYRNPFFVKKTGLYISKALLAHAAYYFKSLGLKDMRLIVDADNTQALMFYRKLGGKFRKYEYAGTPSFLIYLDLNQFEL